MGYLLDEGYLELKGVYVEFHYWILHIWADAEELVRSEQAEHPSYYECLKKMVGRLQRYGGKFNQPSRSEIFEFYSEEARLPLGSPILRRRRKSSTN
jgi:hypothetical protein